MKIVIATGVYPPEIGGPATHTKLLEEHLPSYGISVDVLPFRVVRHLPPGIRHFAYGWKLFWMARGADAVLAQDTVSVGLPAALICMFARVPFMIRVPGDYAWEQGRQRFGVRDSVDDFQKKTYGWRVEALRSVQHFVVRRALRVITPSDYFKHVVSGWGVEPGRIRTIYNGIDLTIESARPAALPPAPFMVSVGRLVPWKGFGTLIDILVDLPTWRLVIIGEGPDRSVLEARAHARGVSERVAFTGALTRAEVFGWYSAGSAFVLNTSFESFSYQVVEAMAAGVPVIATSVGSIPELIENGKEGVLVRPDDAKAFSMAIASVAEEPNAWRARVQAARDTSRRFSVENTVAQFAEEIQHLSV